MKKSVIVSSGLYFITLTFAQAPDSLWTKTYRKSCAEQTWSQARITQYDSLPQMPGWPISINASHATGVSLADLNGDGYLEILLGTEEGQEFHIWDYLGNELPGWPKNVHSAIHSKAAVADIDPSYPGLEIIVPNVLSNIYAWHYDGTDVSGWPHHWCQTSHYSSPTIFDIDYDGDLEIIFSSQTGVFVLNHDCTNYPGWPQYNNSLGTPSVADVDNDGVVEICVQTYDAIYLYDKDGNIESGWPITFQNAHSGPVQPTLADLDGDGDLEILHAYSNGLEHQNYVGIYNHDGTNFGNWPLPFCGPQTYTTPVVGDIDDDGDLEIFGGGHCMAPLPVLLARHHTGDSVIGWPVIVSTMECSPIVFDLDLDDNGKKEILINDNNGIGNLYAYNDDGTMVPGWPINGTGCSFSNSAAVGDVDADGDIEIAFVAGGYVKLWTVEDVEYRPYMTEWGTWFHDNWHTGWFHPLAPQNVNAISSPAFIRLTWTPNTESDLAGYNIYRSDSSGGPYTKINDSIISGTDYYDIPSDSNDYYYCVTGEILAHTESRLSDEVSGHLGIEETKMVFNNSDKLMNTVFRGPLLLPEGKNCKVFDITGRVITSDKIKPGIYFIEIGGVIAKKVVKVR